MELLEFRLDHKDFGQSYEIGIEEEIGKIQMNMICAHKQRKGRYIVQFPNLEQFKGCAVVK